MKVLQPLEVEKQKRIEEGQKVQKAVKLHELVREEESALNLAREEHRKRTEQLATNFLAFSGEIDERKSKLNKEIEEAEARKAKALEPLELAFAESKKKAEEILLRETDLGVKESKLSEEESELEKSKKEFSEKAKELNQRELDLLEEQKASNLIKERTIRGIAKLERDNKFFAIWKEKLSKDVEEYNLTLNRQKVEIEAQRKVNEEKEKKNESERIRLVDLQKTIQDAFEELKNKQ